MRQNPITASMRGHRRARHWPGMADSAKSSRLWCLVGGGIVETAVDLIGTVPLFEQIDVPLRARIEAITDLVSAEAGQVLLHQGSIPEFLYVLLDGQAALSSTAADGTTALVEVLHPIDHFVLASVLTRLPTVMAAHTVTSCRLLAIHADGLLELVEREAP